MGWEVIPWEVGSNDRKHWSDCSRAISPDRNFAWRRTAAAYGQMPGASPTRAWPRSGGVLGVESGRAQRHRCWANDIPRSGSPTDTRAVQIRSASEPGIGNIRRVLEDLLSTGKE